MTAQRTLPPFNFRILEMYLIALILGGLSGWGYWWATQKRGYPDGEVTVIQSLDFSSAIAKLQDALPLELSPQTETSPKAYWLTLSGEEFILSPQALAVSPEDSAEDSLTAVMEELLTDSAKSEDAFTTIPKGTQLLDLSVQTEGIYADLSQEFTEGGGSSSMIHRVVQVLYTLTSLEPEATVYLSIEGQPLDQTYPLGGEGLILQQPITRQTFAKDFSLDVAH